MDTKVIEPGDRVRRRRHSEAFKEEVVRACRKPGISIAAIALANGLNANLVRRWVATAERQDRAPVEAIVSVAPIAGCTTAMPAFVPLQLAPAPTPDIRIELQRDAAAIKVAWPVSAASECAAWLRELLK